MKVNSYSGIKGVAGSRKRAGGVDGSGSFAELMAGIGGESEVASAAPVASTAPMTGLMGLQEVSDGEIARKQLVSHGQSLLDSLEQLRHSLLRGAIPMDVLSTLEARLSRQRQLTNDPRLHALIDDIELRAAVELAKLEMSRAARSGLTT